MCSSGDDSLSPQKTTPFWTQKHKEDRILNTEQDTTDLQWVLSSFVSEKSEKGCLVKAGEPTHPHLTKTEGCGEQQMLSATADNTQEEGDSSLPVWGSHNRQHIQSHHKAIVTGPEQFCSTLLPGTQWTEAPEALPSHREHVPSLSYMLSGVSWWRLSVESRFWPCLPVIPDNLAESNASYSGLFSLGRSGGGLAGCRKSMKLNLGFWSLEINRRVSLSFGVKETFSLGSFLSSLVTHETRTAEEKQLFKKGHWISSQPPSFSCENESALSNKGSSLTWKIPSCGLCVEPLTARSASETLENVLEAASTWTLALLPLLSAFGARLQSWPESPHSIQCPECYLLMRIQWYWYQGLKPNRKMNTGTFALRNTLEGKKK